MLKIDGSMVEGLGQDPRNEAIVSAVVELAHALAQGVGAEGIENAEQLEALRELGCEMGQGCYFSFPVPAEEAIALYTGSGYGLSESLP